MPRRTLLAARACLVLVLSLVAWAEVAQAQPAPAGGDATTTASSTSSIVPTLGTAAAPVDGEDVTVPTLEPSATNRPLTSSEQRLESLDKWAVGAFVLLSLVVVVVRQRRRRDELARDDQPDDERDEWDVALAELTAQYRDDAADER